MRVSIPRCAARPQRQLSLGGEAGGGEGMDHPQLRTTKSPPLGHAPRDSRLRRRDSHHPATGRVDLSYVQREDELLHLQADEQSGSAQGLVDKVWADLGRTGLRRVCLCDPSGEASLSKVRFGGLCTDVCVLGLRTCTFSTPGSLRSLKSWACKRFIRGWRMRRPAASLRDHPGPCRASSGPVSGCHRARG